MTQTLRTFSPQNVGLNILGVDVSGYADGTFIEVTRNEPNSSYTSGADGTVGLTKNANKTGIIKVTLMQNALANLVFAGIQSEQDKSDSDLIRGPASIFDPSGSLFVRVENAHIQTPPGLSVSKEQEPRTWEFFCESIDFLANPNGLVNSSSMDARVSEGVAAALAYSTKISDELG